VLVGGGEQRGQAGDRGLDALSFRGPAAAVIMDGQVVAKTASLAVAAARAHCLGKCMFGVVNCELAAREADGTM
jgi:hypothetical protein